MQNKKRIIIILVLITFILFFGLKFRKYYLLKNQAIAVFRSHKCTYSLGPSCHNNYYAILNNNSIIKITKNEMKIVDPNYNDKRNSPNRFGWYIEFEVIDGYVNEEKFKLYYKNQKFIRKRVKEITQELNKLGISLPTFTLYTNKKNNIVYNNYNHEYYRYKNQKMYKLKRTFSEIPNIDYAYFK